MMEFLAGIGLALWLGILTSISPCPMASNIAAVSFLSKKAAHPSMVFASGLAYTLGRMAAYAILGWAIIGSLLNVPQAAQFLQKYMNKALGPILIIIGLFLLEIITIRLPGISLSEKHRNKLVQSGAPGAFILGFIFSMAFCPVSAALFFGSLINLTLNSKAGLLLPLIYGIGTGLPVFIFAIAISLGLSSLSNWFSRIVNLERYARIITGAIFIIIGLYYTGAYSVKIF